MGVRALAEHFDVAMGILAEVARQLGEIGIQVDARPRDKIAFYEAASTGRSPFHLLGWASDSGDSGDAIEFLAHSASGPRLGRMNTSAMADAAVDAIKQWDKASKEVKLGAIGILAKDDKGESCGAHSPRVEPQELATRVAR